jgi:hypothetical protein
LWRDYNNDGIGFEKREVNEGMKFVVKEEGKRLGEGSVLREDEVKKEERKELVRGNDGKKVVK